MLAELSCALALALGAANVYVDPRGAFALELPPRWVAKVTDLGDGLHLTETYDPARYEGTHIDIVSQQLDEVIDPELHAAVNDAVLTAYLDSLGENGEIQSMKKSKAEFAGRSANRADMAFLDDEGIAWSGYVLTFCGKRHAMAVTLRARKGEAAALKTAEGYLSTFAVDSKTPRAMGSAHAATTPDGGFLNDASLRRLADRLEAGFQRESEDQVLVRGEPPLTYGSVAAFVSVVELLFDVQLTEAEFDASRERFVEYYGKADAEGRRVLAQQGASLLQTLTTGTRAEQEQSRAEGRAVFEQAFRNGAQMGIGYAEVMWRAIERRQNQMAAIEATPTQDGWDSEISEGDLDATLEMLYFMWVAAGRDATDVTADDVAAIRQQIVAALPEMDPQLQLVIANAGRVYAGLRQQWAAAGDEQRLALAGQFGAALDEWGIGSTSVSVSSGGGEGGTTMGELAQNAAWNAAKTWSSP